MPASLVLSPYLCMLCSALMEAVPYLLYGRHIISGSVVCREIEAEDDV